MPELPDVEIFKRYLDATSLHQRIHDVDVRNKYILKDITAPALARGLKGRLFESSRRHGKHLFVRADGKIWLRLHFGMTGSLDYFKDDKQASRHARVIFVFANHHRLAFDDQRQFGQIGLLKDVDEFLKKRSLGPDALDLDLGEFKQILAKRRGAVKSILLNQQLIAGIGNIYADEILFRTRMHPATEISRLDDKALAKLFRATRYILDKAIAAKADVEQMPKSWLLPHRGKGGKCPRCGEKLRSAKIGGRTAWFCARCQKKI
ncbi:MAG: formamidopyrimidine-DNA glycosylase [Verrucomicrobia bacterium]|nr:MAG: formamidopyrimidine-DNA glycosylase [Verrucomicrobiota bacterium]PYL63964.1 MAG: formamidopyrimidine-DNA glycosylase [Verrucomicrobiota bacterium]